MFPLALSLGVGGWHSALDHLQWSVARAERLVAGVSVAAHIALFKFWCDGSLLVVAVRFHFRIRVFEPRIRRSPTDGRFLKQLADHLPEDG